MRDTTPVTVYGRDFVTLGEIVDIGVNDAAVLIEYRMQNDEQPHREWFHTIDSDGRPGCRMGDTDAQPVRYDPWPRQAA